MILTLWYIYHKIKEVLNEKFGNDITRILYFFIYERKIILTNGFIKKTRKTPIEQIQTAKARRKDFLERMEQNENV